MRISRIALAGILLLALISAGCVAGGSPFASSEPSSPYYVSEFSDVSIPREMSEVRGETYITFAPSGIKCGMQQFSGHVEVVSLMNMLRRHMSANGWVLRSLLRSKQSFMTFDKDERVCVMHIVDGLVYTDLTVFMSAKLAGDSGAPDISAYSHPEAGN